MVRGLAPAGWRSRPNGCMPTLSPVLNLRFCDCYARARTGRRGKLPRHKNQPPAFPCAHQFCYRTPQRDAKPRSGNNCHSSKKTFPQKYRQPQNPCPKGFSARFSTLLKRHPESWPLDCICLYVQVKTYAYESRRLDHRPLIRRCAPSAHWLARPLPGLVWIDC